MEPQPPIADLALLGDGQTAALVGRDGSIVWLPWPAFDSPSLFGALLDGQRGGAFFLGCDGPGASRRRYLPGTNVLETHVDTPEGAARLIDFLTVASPPSSGALAPRSLVRLLRGVAGIARLEMICAPRPDYARQPPIVTRRDERSFAIEGAGLLLTLVASVPVDVERQPDGALGLVARMTVREGEEAWVILSGDGEPPGDGRALLNETVAFWRDWIAKLSYRGPHREHVERSALALKAMIYAPTGAIIAAPTTSLPERPGGARNWDYRFSWLRDATMTLAALHGVGYTDEAAAFFRWLFDVARLDRPDELQVLYGIRGERENTERELAHLAGYHGARPVRVGNLAARQLQLDVYGELIDAAWTFRERFGDGARDHLASCVRAAAWVAEHAGDVDDGIWEMRGRRQHFVHSQAMCWLALERGARLAVELGDPDTARTLGDAAARVRALVLARGYDAGRGIFVQSWESRTVDASLLRLPLIGFLPATDARMVRTVAAIRDELSRYGLLLRYRDVDDGVGGDENTFAICSFWLVENLALQGRQDEAEALFRRLLSYGSDLGLFAEEIDPERSQQWGNFPQAFTHLGLLRAAVRLERGYLRPRESAAASGASRS